jgi:tripartite-type tricarboxylate transporter receptor subunit TctC
MDKKMRKFGLLAAVLTILAAGFGAARAQNSYPTQPVRVIIPFPAGSTTDALTCIVADGLRWTKTANDMLASIQRFCHRTLAVNA